MTSWKYNVTLIYCVLIQICLVYSQDFGKTSLTFVIDDSQSMTDEIEQVKRSVDSIFDTVMMSNGSHIENYVLVTFNDPDYILHVVTKNKEELKTAASKVYVRYGNPSCPEKAMTGIQVAIKNSLPLSTLYVFTDASAKDAEMFEEVKSMALKKQIQVTFMLTGDCGSRDDKLYQVYNQLAKSTYGELFNLMKTDITDILEYVKENTKSRSDIIESKSFPPGYGHKLTYSVDSKMNDLIISVTGLKPKIEVTDSGGKVIDIKHIVNKEEIAIVKATDLKPGVYIADVGSTSETYVKVMGKTDVNFYYGFSPFETSSLNDTATRPAPDGDAYLSIKLHGEGVILKVVRIFDMDGNILEELPLRLVDEKEKFYVTKAFHPPSVAFQLSVFGFIEENKSIIKRTSVTPIVLQNVEHETVANVAPLVTITEGPTIFVDYRSPLKLKCKVHGYPKPDITWQEKDSGVIIPSTVSMIEAPYDFISILNIKELHKNITYECKAQNTFGTNFSSIDVKTNVYFNVLEKPPDITEVEHGKESIMRCIVDAFPPASIAWYRNGSLLSNDTNIMISSDMKIVTIKYANLESQGMFMCEVKNEFTWMSFFSKVTIIGLEKPIIDKPDGKMHAVKGTDAQLTCSILRGTPKPTVRWHFQDRKGKKFRELKETQGALLLKNVSVDDVGTYTCNASNIVGSQSYTMDFIVEYPPKIKEDGINIIQVIDGDEVTLPCNVDGVPPPTVKWFRNGTTLHSSKNIFTTTDHSLKIKTIKVSHTGNYTCESQNSLGITKKSIFIYVFEIPALEKPDTIMHAVKGTDIQLTCRILRGTPKPTIRWHFQDQKGKTFRELKETKEALLLTNVSVDDAGTYTCNASNIVGSQSYTMDFTVEYQPIIKEDGINIIQVIDGDEVTLPCNVDSVPPPTVKWLRNGTTLHSSKNVYTTTDHSLKITPITVPNTGYYTCEAENYLGSSNKKIFVFVFVPVNIEIPKLSTIDIMVGGNLILPCQADGYPEPKIEWFFRNFDTKTAPMKLRSINKRTDFNLRRVQLKDQGNFTCVASNIGGSSNITYTVNVIAPPIIEDVYADKTFTCVVGDLVLRIQCKATGSPKPSIEWKKDGVQILPGSESFDIEDGTLLIKNIEKRQQGTYTCSARNRIGNSNMVYNVIVYDYPVVTRLESPIFISPGMSLIVPCYIPHNDTDLIRWYKDSRFISYGKLTLEGTTYLDTGVYSCRVSDIWKSLSAHVEIKMGYKPYFITDEPEIIIINFLNGLHYPLECIAKGEPIPKIIWNYNGKTLNVVDMVYKIKMAFSNRGKYTCEISNSFGSIKRSFRISSQDCILDVKKDFRHNKQPMMLTPEMTWPLFPIVDGFMLIKKSEPFYLHCTKGFTKFRGKFIRAFCFGETRVQINGDIYEHSAIKCKRDIEPIIRKMKKRCLRGKTKNVKVGYQIYKKFLTVYSVCLDKDKNVTIYTRHTLSPAHYNVSTTENLWWPSSLLPYYFDTIYNCTNQAYDISSILERPFHNDNRCCFGKRQLVSPMDLQPGVPTTTAYSYLNVVPHWSTCNFKNWVNIEQKVRDLTKLLNNKLIILTGTAEPLQMKARSGYRNFVIHDDRGRKLPVAQYLWKVVQHPASSSSLAIIQVNVPDLSRADVFSHVHCRDICNKIEWMKGSDWDNVANGYTYCCSILDFESAFNYRGQFSRGKTYTRILNTRTDYRDDY